MTTLGQIVAVEGKICCKKPLRSRYGSRDCVYARTEVRHQRDWVRGASRTADTLICSDQDATLFELDDGTGRALVDLTGAEIEAKESVDSSLPVGKHRDLSDALAGRLLGALANKLGVVNSEAVRADIHRATSGFLNGRPETGTFFFTEWILAADGHLFLVGKAARVEGRVVITAPAAGTTQFFATFMKRDQLLASHRHKSAALSITLLMTVVAFSTLVYLGTRYGFVNPNF